LIILYSNSPHLPFHYSTATNPSNPATPIIAAGISVAIAKPEEVFELLVDDVPACVLALVLLFVPVKTVVEPVADPVNEPLPVLEAPLVLNVPVPLPSVFPGRVVTPTIPPSPVEVTTLGAPLILPTLTATLNSLTLLSRLAILAEYCVGTAVNHSGVVEAVRPERRRDATSPVKVCAEAAEERAG
jgi:hypothetical protein